MYGMDWFITAFSWYLALLVLGIGFFPLTRTLFSSWIDHGYPFAKTIAILILSYTMFIMSTLHILPFIWLSIAFVTVVFFSINFVYFRKKKQKINFRLLIFEELLFLVSFFFLVCTRGQEASVRGLEKFMDFGFMNSILRSQYFPPLDMWYSGTAQQPQGFPINYYYFGHLTGAFLIRIINIVSSVGYNLILATIFGQGITLAFSICLNLIYLFEKLVLKIKKVNVAILAIFGLIGSYLVNLAGNLHTIYLFTKGYPNEKPIPFWEIFSTYTPEKYWYPNATRFIPFTIHEFPSYSYVVADLHGHVFDIPFILLTIALLVVFLVRSSIKKNKETFSKNDRFSWYKKLDAKYHISYAALFGFLTAVHYMTNAFDGPIYLLLVGICFAIVYGFSYSFLVSTLLVFVFFLLFSLPFSINFSPFASGIGVNCSPPELVALKKLGPFLFEKGNCQVSPLWMLFVLWGFFAINFLLLLVLRLVKNSWSRDRESFFPIFIFSLFAFGFFLILIPEFFYIKDIYPAHFRANTMFKLGYQAFIMMSIASTFVFYLIWKSRGLKRYVLKACFLVPFFLVFLYPFFSFPSYYGKYEQTPNLVGDSWLAKNYPEDKEIADYLNKHVKGQPTILEAQGDSYTDYNRISAYTGLPTVAGWWVHEWLWRGTSTVVGERIPDIVAIYESPDPERTKKLIKKYRIGYIIVSHFEKEKYKKIDEKKFGQIGRKIFESTNKNGAIYQVKPY